MRSESPSSLEIWYHIMSTTTKSQQHSTLVPIPYPRHNDVIVIGEIISYVRIVILNLDLILTPTSPTEKRFGYDRLGIIISLLVICFLVVLICIPTALEYFGDDYKQINNIVLVSLIIVLILVSLGEHIGCTLGHVLPVHNRSSLYISSQVYCCSWTFNISRQKSSDSTPRMASTRWSGKERDAINSRKSEETKVMGIRSRCR